MRYSHLILFDIDGTLAHCGPTPRRVFKRALIDTFGTAGPIDSWIFDGKTDPMIVRELMAEAGVACKKGMVDLALAQYARDLGEELPVEPAKRAYPGVRELLAELSRRPALLGLLTGNIRAGAKVKLGSLDLWRHFVLGAFADDSPVRRELADIAVERAFAHSGQQFEGKRIVIIGDTEHDIACGRHLSAKTIGVATGRSSGDQLRAHGADHVFEDLSGTAAVLSAIMA